MGFRDPDSEKTGREASCCHGPEMLLCLLVCLAKMFSIGLVASSETEITPKHLHKDRIPSCKKTSVSASLADM
jgi:hypothetical protein